MNENRATLNFRKYHRRIKMQNQENNRILIITGEAGTGKTWLIKLLKKEFGLKPTATTWAAASLTDGITYYRAERFKGNFHLKPIGRIIKKSKKTMLIDEASMLSQEKLDYMLTKWPNRKFILVGDWRQLDPVDGTAINPNNYPLIELVGSHRTQDPNLINVLNSILEGNEARFKKLISSRVMKNKFDDEKFSNRIYLQHTNVKRELNTKIKTKGSLVIGLNKLIKYNLDGVETGYCDYTDSNAWWYNNEFCTIKNFTTEGMELIRYNGETRFVRAEDEKFWIDGASLTCHKVQGQTIEKSDIIIEDDFVGSPEQRQKLLYVAISRVVSLDQIHFRAMPKTDSWKKLIEFTPFLVGDSGSVQVLDAIKQFCFSSQFIDTIYNVNELQMRNKNDNILTIPGFLKNKISKLGLAGNFTATDLINLAFNEHSIFKQINTGATYINKTGSFIAKNPLIQGARKNSKENIAYPLHWFCFEFDDISQDEQLKLVYDNKDFIFCIISVQNKSPVYHVNSK